MLLAPVVVNRKGEHVEMIEEFRSQGFVRWRGGRQGDRDDAFPSSTR